MVEVGVEVVPLAARRRLLGRGVRAHLLDEDPVAQPLRRLALGLGLGELYPIAAEVDLHLGPGWRGVRRLPAIP